MNIFRPICWRFRPGQPKLAGLSLVFLFVGIFGHAQTREEIVEEARADVGILAGEEYAGRGYQKDGHTLAASYIEDVFKLSGLKPARPSEDEGHPYFQYFNISLNKIDSASVKINGDLLEIGEDYIMNPASGGHEAISKVKFVGNGLPFEYPGIGQNQAVLIAEGMPAKVLKKDELKEKYKSFKSDYAKIGLAAQVNASAVILLKKKLTAGLSARPFELPVIEVKSDLYPKPKKIRSVEVNLVRSFEKVRTQNVIGMVEGKIHPDSFLILSAHYDHLGKMGDAIFYGANDNASGTAMLLSLARHYAKPENQPDKSIVFIAFGAEEAGLEGSKFYVNRDPLVPLANTNFVLNLDLMGNGDKGIVAVAGHEYAQEFELLKSENEKLEAVPLVKARRNAPNSDHYWFVEKGVHAFFIYTLGGPPHYHDVHDTPEELVFSRYYEIRGLFLSFLGKL